jgi:hypothetical protein
LPAAGNLREKKLIPLPSQRQSLRPARRFCFCKTDNLRGEMPKDGYRAIVIRKTARDDLSLYLYFLSSPAFPDAFSDRNHGIA